MATITYRTIGGQIITLDQSKGIGDSWDIADIRNQANDAETDEGTIRDDVLAGLIKASEWTKDTTGNFGITELLDSVKTGGDVDGTGTKSDVEKLKAKLQALLDAKGDLTTKKADVDKEVTQAEAEYKTASEKTPQTGTNKTATDAAKAKLDQAKTKQSNLANALAQTESALTTLKDKATTFVNNKDAIVKTASAAEQGDAGAAIDSLKDFLVQKSLMTAPANKPGDPNADGKGGTTTPQAAPQGGAPAGGSPYAGYTQPGLGGGMAAPTDMAFQGWLGDMKMDSMDDIFKMQGDSKKMMMMLMYLSRMAASGDLGAMYMFLRFISYVICKDKAMQNISLGNKMLDLQTASRELTNQLTGAEAYKKDDPGVGAKFQQTMETVRAGQGELATEQKLIGSMLEEMTQVSEMMTNMIKSMLDARGRELQMVSSWR